MIIKHIQDWVSKKSEYINELPENTEDPEK